MDEVKKVKWWQTWTWLIFQLFFTGVFLGIIWYIAVKTYKMPTEIKNRIAEAKTANLKSTQNT